MTPGARISAAVEVLEAVLSGTPAEQALLGWSRASRFAGSKDRAAVRDHVFDALRCRRSYAALGGAETGRGVMIGLVRAQGLDPDALFSGEGHAPAPVTAAEAGRVPEGAEASDMPDWLFDILRADHGDAAEAIARAQQTRAPVFLRVARARTTPDKVAAGLAADGIDTVGVDGIPTALRVTTNPRRVQNHALYQNGAVELQDAGAQRLCLELPLTEGARVLDYCAGGGGKILALADRAKIRAFAHDAIPRRMKDLPARAARAGQSVALLDDPGAQAPFDLVLCDVPCSGSGTWRRTPQAKWDLTPERLEDLTRTQAQILRDAAPLVGPGGTLAYATCSVLARENCAQIDGFLSDHPGWAETRRLNLLPGPDGDGFFLSLLQRPSPC